MDHPETQPERSGSPPTLIDCIEESATFPVRPPTYPLTEYIKAPRGTPAWCSAMENKVIWAHGEIERLQADNRKLLLAIHRP